MHHYKAKSILTIPLPNTDVQMFLFLHFCFCFCVSFKTVVSIVNTIFQASASAVNINFELTPVRKYVSNKEYFTGVERIFFFASFNKNIVDKVFHGSFMILNF